MNTKLKNSLTLLIILLCAGCFRNDIRTATFHIDQLRTPESAQLLANTMRGLVGIQSVQPNLNNKTCTVVFNGRELYLKNIEYAIVHGGFSLPHWPAQVTDKNKLPEELR